MIGNIGDAAEVMKHDQHCSHPRRPRGKANKLGKEIKRRMYMFTSKAFSALLVNMRRFISLPDLFPPTPTNCPWVYEDALYSVFVFFVS